RYVPMFGDSEYDPVCAYDGAVPLEEQLEALARAVRAGKVRYVGLSNETPWGLHKALTAASLDPSLPRVVSLQNAYSLTCRTFDNGLAEVCHLEGVGLMAYSPLAMGLLTVGIRHNGICAPMSVFVRMYMYGLHFLSLWSSGFFKVPDGVPQSPKTSFPGGSPELYLAKP
ncbi:hypothetical protein Vretimale_15505, partial [Volvox reticuliferus]